MRAWRASVCNWHQKRRTPVLDSFFLRLRLGKEDDEFMGVSYGRAVAKIVCALFVTSSLCHGVLGEQGV